MSTQLLPPPGHVVSADGTRLGVRRSGDGPPLVLVHGAAADHTRWAPVLPALERRFTVHALDRRGRGLSGDGPYHSLDREVDDVAAVVRAAGDDVAVLGHSFGAVLALEAALRTDAAARLVLYEGPVGFLQTPAAVVDRLQALLDAGDRDGLLECFLVEVAGLPREQVAQLRTLDAWQGRRAAAHTIPREERANREYVFDADRLSAVRVPTLLLGGGDSPAPFHAANAALRAALPDARIAVMPGQRHAAMDTGTALFLDTVLPFLDPARP